MKVGLEVSNIVQQVKTATGTLTYQLGSRNATTTLRLKDGETQVLAGLISDEDRASASRVPGLGDLPLLGRLFSSHRDEGNKTEIVLLITPRILRQVERPELAESEFLAGTEATVSYQPLRLRPSAGLPGRAPVEADVEEPPPADQPPPPEAPPAAVAPVAPIIRPTP
jgi:general secretion pathway protein D